MLNRLPSQMPPLDVMLHDIGNPSAAELAKALHVSERQVRRWKRAGCAPQPAMLAIFWLTRWGMSIVDAEAVNAARLHVGMAGALKAHIQRLQARLERMGRLGDFGAANDPAPEVRLPGVAESIQPEGSAAGERPHKPERANRVHASAAVAVPKAQGRAARTK